MLLLTFFGFFMAILANMTGIEDGIVFVPLFILLLGLSLQEAAGVSMATMIFGLGAGSLGMGGHGYTRDYTVERLSRDARGLTYTSRRPSGSAKISPRQ